MTLSVGTKLGPYEILAPIGAGGMGEVYRARDPRVGRDIAIKVSAEQFSERFEREIHAVASLNHSNICTLYDVGPNFLVMELVEGPTLADRIKQGPIPLEESLEIARQIADALEAAHEKGMVHRDLKPANIKLKPDGTVKVLDFGLAKVGGTPAVSSDNSPTLSVAQTAAGVILGTAAYMSPEQARGKTVDKRTDIWAFSCVLYEMLTGQAAFQGDDVSEILASVIRAEPEWAFLPANLHWRLREILQCCLKKEPKARYHDIADVQLEIQKALADPKGGAHPVAARSQSRFRLVLPWVAAAVILCLFIGGLAFWKLNTTPLSEPHLVTRFSYLLPRNQKLTEGRYIAISPDGTKLVYATTGGLYLRPMDQLDAKLIPGTEGDVEDPFFSPDGNWLGFNSSGEPKKIPVTGGSPITLCEAKNNYAAVWQADNTIVFDQNGGPTMRVSANGGPPEPILDRKDEFVFSPQILPDGKTVMFTLLNAESRSTKIVVQSLASGKRKVLFPGRAARYLPTGHIVYALESGLFAVGFNPNSLGVTGVPVSVVPGVVSFGTSQYAVSNSGTLAYLAWDEPIGSLVWIDRQGKEEPIDAPARTYSYARLSPDGTRIALDIWDQKNSKHDIWIWDLVRKTLSRFSFNAGTSFSPVWTPDGKRLAFATLDREGAANIYWQAADSSGTPELLTKVSNSDIGPMSFFPDGKQLLLTESSLPSHISLLELKGGAAPKHLFESSAFNETNPQISPDGRWLAYQSNESGTDEIFVRPYPNVDAGRWQISSGSGICPVWNSNGRELFYYSSPGTMMAVPVETGSSFKAGTPHVAFKVEYSFPIAPGPQYPITPYSVTPDGRRFLMIKEAAASGGVAPQINIVLNWFEELKQRVPTSK